MNQIDVKWSAFFYLFASSLAGSGVCLPVRCRVDRPTQETTAVAKTSVLKLLLFKQ